MTLDDIERPLYAVLHYATVIMLLFFGACHKTGLKCYAIGRKCSSGTLSSGNVKFMRIFVGMAGEGKGLTDMHSDWTSMKCIVTALSPSTLIVHWCGH